MLGNASFGTTPSSLGQALTLILTADDIEPGSDVSYQLAKAIYLYHPLGHKMAQAPISLAQSQAREIAVPDSPEDAVLDAFNTEWVNLDADRLILNLMTQARVYGVSTLTMLIKGLLTSAPIPYTELWKKTLSFNVLDPLNTSGSLVYDQDPNSFFFQKHGDVTVQGMAYHRSRTLTMMNEEPIYIAWTSSAFGYVGRSVYQRALYPLKSFLQTMIADDMVSRKVGALVVKVQSPGSIIDRITSTLYGNKRTMVKQASTGNVLSIGLEESIESLNLQNLDGPLALVRNDILKNIATAADMPAKLLTQEAFVEGFGEGTQDAYAIAQYIDEQRKQMNPAYAFLDRIAQHRAWNPEFYETIQARFPEYKKIDYATAFYRWQRAFTATWPDLVKEKPSEAVEVDDKKIKAVASVVQILLPALDPENTARTLEFFVDIINVRETIFEGARLDLDYDALADYLQEQKEKAEQQQAGGGENPLAEAENSGKPPKPFGRGDSMTRLIESLRSAS